MKSSLFKQALACAILAVTANAHAVVESGHWTVQPYVGSLEANLAITIDQTPAGDYTGTFFNYNPQLHTLEFVTLNTDEGSHLFLARPGDILTDQSIKNSNPESFNNGPVAIGNDFYLGASTSKFTDPEFNWANPVATVFGWAHFQADTNGTLRIVDSAMAFREGGIIVGTTQAVPEPATVAMTALGLFGIAMLRNRRTKAKSPR